MFTQVGSKIGTYNQNRAKKWKPLMSSLTGTQSSNLISTESFKKLVKEGMVDRTTMRFDSGKVRKLCTSVPNTWKVMLGT